MPANENGNLELIRSLYANLRSGNLDAAAALFAEDVVISSSVFVQEAETTYRGHDGLCRWWTSRVDAGMRSLTASSFDVDGDDVLVRGWVTTRRGRSGMTVRAQWRWRVRDRLIVWMEGGPEHGPAGEGATPQAPGRTIRTLSTRVR